MKNQNTEVLTRASELALEFLATLQSRPVRASATHAELLESLDLPLKNERTNELEVLDDLVRGVDPGIIGSAAARYFGFVIGGSLPVTVAADWMTSAWDQNAGTYSTSPAASVVEEVAARWILDLLHLPSSASVGFVTGCQMANFTALASARHAVLHRVGWNVEEQGVFGAPKVNVVTGAEAHVTVYVALRMLGFGTTTAIVADTDAQGRLRPESLRKHLAQLEGPTIVCLQAGNVNTGSFDPFPEAIEAAHAAGAWVHVDSAFGLWAAASTKRRHLVDGIAGADSWATDAHKWLNVPYDSGLVIVADSAAHRASMTVTAAYLQQTAGVERDNFDWAPEFSRRARGFTVYAAIRHLGRSGIAELIDRCCDDAALFATLLRDHEGIEILNEVVLNQVLVRFHAEGRDSDELTRAVIQQVQSDGICWLGGTTWHGVAAMRISVSNWATTAEDVRVSAEAIVQAMESVLG